MSQLVNIALLVIVGVSLIAVGYSMAELRGGWREVKTHWWSTAPFVFLTISGAWLWLNLTRGHGAEG